MRFFIATPAWNSLEKLKRCVGSVRNELRTADGTHFVQDAASSDGTAQWLEAQSDLGFRSEPDRGMYDAINRAWAGSDGDVLSWINCDEQYLPGTLAKVQAIFESDPSVDVVTGDYIVVAADGAPIAARREIGVHRPLIAAGLMNVATCATFYRRRLLDDGLLALDTRYRYAADLDLVLRLLRPGVRWVKVKDYFSLFAFDGTNLSCSPKMLEESAAIVREARGPLPVGVARFVRAAMRVVAGCYRPADLAYAYVCNEQGDTVQVSATKLPWTYRQR